MNEERKTNPCSCGLTFETMFWGYNLVEPGGVCTAFKRGLRTETYGELLTDHPQWTRTPTTITR